MKHLLIFTDLDGTLLDHYSYCWEAARPALAKIKALEFPLVLSSSKTAAEISRLRVQLDNQHPFIVENGAAVAVPAGYFGSESIVRGGPLDWIRFGPGYRKIVRVINQIRAENGYEFRGFNDMSAAEVSQLTGLSLDGSKKAKMRQATEPLVWRGNEKSLQDFEKQLRAHGLNLTRGGRFYHVTGKTDKAKGVKWLKHRYNSAWPERQFISVGLGDGPNDIGMLEAVDIAVVMKPAHGCVLQLETDKRVLFSEAPGPEGWCQTMQQILGESLDG